MSEQTKPKLQYMEPYTRPRQIYKTTDRRTGDSAVFSAKFASPEMEKAAHRAFEYYMRGK